VVVALIGVQLPGPASWPAGSPTTAASGRVRLEQRLDSLLSWVVTADNRVGSQFASHKTWYLDPALPGSVGFGAVSCPLDRTDTPSTTRPVQHLRVGELVEDQLVQAVLHAGALPLP
jgi:hypothetical protein